GDVRVKTVVTTPRLLAPEHCVVVLVVPATQELHAVEDAPVVRLRPPHDADLTVRPSDDPLADAELLADVHPTAPSVVAPADPEPRARPGLEPGCRPDRRAV